MSIIIRNIVGRCHVGDTNREVIRYVISRMKHGYQTFKTLPREQRKDFLRQIVQDHKDNRELYSYVMRGGI